MSQQTKLPTPPTVSDQALQDWINGVHSVITNLSAASVAPNAPTSLQVTPIAGGNVIQFTRSNAARYVLFMSDTPDRAKASQVDLGPTNTYTDNVGVGAKLRYYWAQGLSTNGIPSTLSALKSGTTLALGTPNPVIPIPVQSFAQVFDTALDRNRPVIATTDPNVAGQPSAPE